MLSFARGIFVAVALVALAVLGFHSFGSPQVTGNGGSCPSPSTVIGNCNSTGVTGNGRFAPTPTPQGAPTLPPLIPGQEYATSFAPFSTGPWSQKIQSNCGSLPVGQCVTTWSQSIINSLMGSTCSDCFILHRGGPAGGGGVGQSTGYYAKVGDPTITINCNSTPPGFCDNVDNGGFPGQSGSTTSLTFKIQIPAVARVPGGNCTDNGDHALFVIQPNGSEYDFGYAGCFSHAGSGPGGNWQNGDSLSVGAAANAGNFSSASGFLQHGLVSSSGGALAAGKLRGNEAANGSFNHALRIISQCTGAPGGAAAVFPVGPFGIANASVNCAGGANAGLPFGARYWWDETAAVTFSCSGCSGSNTERGVFDSFHTYGAIVSDNVGGGTANGIGEFTTDGGPEFSQYAIPLGSNNNDPYTQLADFCDGGFNPVENSEAYFLHSPSTPCGNAWSLLAQHFGDGSTLDVKIHGHWVMPCASTPQGC